MGQIFSRISRIIKSNSIDNDLQYAESIINEDDELKRIIEELTSENSKKKEKKTEYKYYGKSNNNTDDLVLSAYQLLGLSQYDSIETIKLAYKKKIKENHPDKFVNVSKEIHNLAIEKTQKINQAYNVLKKERNFN